METARTLLAQARLSFQHDRVNDAARYAHLAALQAAQAYMDGQGDVLLQTQPSQTSDELMACFARFAKADPRVVEQELSYLLHRTAQLKAQYDIEPPASASSDLARIEEGLNTAARFVDKVCELTAAGTQ